MSARSKDEWLGLEGTLNGKPLLARFRTIPADAARRKRFPFLFRIDWAYPVDTTTALPSKSVYRAVSKFEDEVIDELERAGAGILFAAETSDGTIRYSLMVRDPAPVQDRISHSTPKRVALDLSADRDPEWREFKRLSKALLGRRRKG